MREKQEKRVCRPRLSYIFVGRACTDSAEIHTEVSLKDSVDVQNMYASRERDKVHCSTADVIMLVQLRLGCKHCETQLSLWRGIAHESCVQETPGNASSRVDQKREPLSEKQGS